MLDWQRLKSLVERYRSLGKIVGFTNGCFDILHLGHVTYLLEAKRYCDILIVALNSDESIKRLKGDFRPIMPLEHRLRLVSALFFVDYVTAFDEDTPVELISYLKPDIYFKGGDYRIEEIPEYKVMMELGGKAIGLGLIDGISTSIIIEHIVKRYSR